MRRRGTSFSGLDAVEEEREVKRRRSSMSTVYEDGILDGMSILDTPVINYTTPYAPPAHLPHALPAPQTTPLELSHRPSLEQAHTDSNGNTTKQTDSDEEVEAAVRLEFVALGRDGKADHLERSGVRDRRVDGVAALARHPDVALWASGLPAGAKSSETSPAQASPMGASSVAQATSPATRDTPVLPPRELCDALVRYALEKVAWHFGCVHDASFLAECDEFWSLGPERLQLVNQAWLAFLYAILCAAAQHLDPTTALECALTEEDLREMPKRFFDASVAALYAADFLAKHAIHSAQAIVVLVVTCQSIGPSDLLATLLSVGIRTCQHLNLHRLGSDEDWLAKRKRAGVDPYSPRGKRDLIDREVRKRVWVALTVEDWVSVPYRRSYAIFPDHVSTAFPVNAHDKDLAAGWYVARAQDEPTAVGKLILSVKIAACIRRLFDKLAQPGGSTSDAYELALEIDAEVREIARSAPAFLQPEADLSALPGYVDWQRYNWVFQIQHTILVLHRPFLGRSFKDPKYAYSRRAALDAARAILAQFAKGRTRDTPHLWTTAYHAIASGTVLMLDVFQASGQGEDVRKKREEVRRAVEELEWHAKQSPIAARGCLLLENLLNEELKRAQQLALAAQQPATPRAATSNIRSAPRPSLPPTNAIAGQDRFEAAAKRASMSLSDHSNNTSPASLSAQNPALPAGFSPLPMREGNLPSDLIESMLFSGMGAPLGGEEGSGLLLNGSFFDEGEMGGTGQNGVGGDLWETLVGGWESAGHAGLGGQGGAFY